MFVAQIWAPAAQQAPTSAPQVGAATSAHRSAAAQRAAAQGGHSAFRFSSVSWSVFEASDHPWRDRGLPWRAGVVRGEALVCVRGQGSSVAKSWSSLEVRDHPWRCVRLLWRPVIISSEVVVCCGDQGSTHGAPAANVRPSATRLLWPAAAAVAAAAICVVVYSQW